MTTEPIRLQKVLAAAGIGSRRYCEILIEQGRVEVDGIIASLGDKADPEQAVIRVDGKRIPTAAGLSVLALNKPKGMLTAMADDRGRPCVGDLLADRPDRLFHVGRLDADTTGLLLLTNDGTLANRIAHPTHGMAKTYVATVNTPLPKGLTNRLQQGVQLDDGPARAESARITSKVSGRAMVEVVVHEGRNRIVRRMFEAAGSPVVELTRTRIGPVTLGNLRPGQLRPLVGDQLRLLYTEAGL